MQDVDLMQRLQYAESDLLTALLDGTQALASYHQAWSALLGELLIASQNGNVGRETLSLAHLVASRISVIATCFLDLKRYEESSTVQLQRDYDAILHQMAGLDVNTHSHSDGPSGVPRSSECSNAPISDAESSSPLIVSAYRWLLDNLHNPYPTAQVKARIAATASCRVSSINTWFINARRRIGWTTLCRERFSNRRADMIDAAYRALVEEDPQHTLSPDLRHSFITMKEAAENLYCSTFTRNSFTRDLDAIVDVTKQHEEPVAARKSCSIKPGDPTKTIRDSYPSPDRSIEASPVPVFGSFSIDEIEEEADDFPPVTAGSKRCRSSAESTDQSPSVRRSIKRLRTSMKSQMYLPSPPSSVDGIDIPSDDGLPETSLYPGSRGTLPTRKRRLSDADNTSTPKRPRDSMAASRLHAVSDPLPFSNMENECSIDDWFNTHFDALFAIPPPVDAIEPDLSASWEVELFKDYSIPGNSKCLPKCHPTSTTDAHTSGAPELDSLFQSIAGDSFISLSESITPPDITTPYTSSLDATIPDMLHIDWATLSSPDTHQAGMRSASPQYPVDTQPLPEIDLSVLQLPRVMPPVIPQPDAASKQAKLHQLHTMQEAVRRMEQELQSEGIII